MSSLRSKHWQEVHAGKRCNDCAHKKPLLVVVMVYPPDHPWRPNHVYMPIARCVDREGCATRVERQRAARSKLSLRARVRSKLFVLEEPKAPDAKPPYCAWCGEKIVLADPVAGYRFAQRRYHRGDEHEIGDRNCVSEYNRSRTWDARTAVERIEREKHGVVACRECGLIVAGADPMSGEDCHPWEADHIVPLEDGGEHELENLQPLCVPHHREKTARENAARRRAA